MAPTMRNRDSESNTFDLRTPALILAERWLRHADLLRQYGETQGATACELHAQELMACWEDWESQPLTLDEASAESGLSRDHLGRLVRSGDLEDVGQHGAPRIRRGDLPKKRRQTSSQRQTGDVSSFQQIARSVVDSEEGEHDG